VVVRGPGLHPWTRKTRVKDQKTTKTYCYYYYHHYYYYY